MAGILDRVLSDGSLTRNNTMAYGMYKGYYTIVQMLINGQSFLVRMNYNLPENFDLMGFKNRAVQYINSMKIAEKKITATNVTDHTLEVQIAPSALAKKTAEMIDRIVNGLVTFLAAESAGTGCQLCGTDLGVSCFNLNGTPHFLCPNCSQASLNQLEAERQSKLSEKSNPILGLIGALIGAVIGSVLWILLLYAGWYAGIAALAILGGAMKGYTLLGKNLDRKGVIISLLVSLVIIYAANDVSFRIAMYTAMRDHGRHISFWKMNEDWNSIMKLNDAWGKYYANLAIGYIMFIIAGSSSVVQAFKNASGNYHMKKM